MRNLVIGGASLLGAHLCERLLARGDEVVALDDLSSGAFASIAHLTREPRFAFVEHDVTAAFDAHVDAVFHLAVPSTHRACTGDPVHATLTGVVGTLHALEVAARHGARVVLQTSLDRFGHGVRCAESLTAEFARSRGRAVDARLVRVARPFGPYASLDDPHPVLRLALAALRGDASALTALDRTHAEDPDAPMRVAFAPDVAETLVRALDAPRRLPAIAAPFWTSTVREITAHVLDAAGIAPVLVNTAPDPSAQGSSPGSVAHLATRATRAPLAPLATTTTPEPLSAVEVLGQSPAIDLAEALRRTVAWVDARLGPRHAPRTSGVFSNGVTPVALGRASAPAAAAADPAAAAPAGTRPSRAGL